jgi:hypothetical protein
MSSNIVLPSSPEPWFNIYKKAFRENLVPGVVLQTFALALVLSFYFLPVTRQFWDSVAELKVKLGLAFPVIFTSLCGGLIPFGILAFKGKIVSAVWWKTFWFYLIFWAYRGSEVDLFYQLMTHVFGDQQTFGIVAKKVMVDQFVYSFLWTGPTTAILFEWKNEAFNLASTYRKLDRLFWLQTMPSFIFSIWIVWLPAVTVIYCLPQNLQFPLFNIVLVFFVLLVSSLKKD